MTHKDIYTKFMIEYDKANVTSSYPSLTEYEVATVLDKAYNALIAQKVTGNNIRRVALEGDLKSVVDLQPLVTRTEIDSNKITKGNANSGATSLVDNIDNTMSVKMPEDFLYYIGCNIKKKFAGRVQNSTRSNAESLLIYTSKCTRGSAPAGVSQWHFTLTPVDDFKNVSVAYNGDTTASFSYLVTDLFVGQTSYEYQTLAPILHNATLEDIKNAITATYSNHSTDGELFVYVWTDDAYSSSREISVYGGSVAWEGPIDLVHSSGTDPVYRKMPVKLVSHQMAEKFMASASNVPWVKTPVCYIEDGKMCIVYDSYDIPTKDYCEIIYIRKPNKFVKDKKEIERLLGSIPHTFTYFGLEYELPEADDDMDFISKTGVSYTDTYRANDMYKFECNDTVAEELISLAIAFALENVESLRLNSKLNMRGLEA